jgi:site-specific DNA recombinase
MRRSLCLLLSGGLAAPRRRRGPQWHETRDDLREDLLAEPSPAPTPADLGILRDHIRDVLQAGNRPQTKALLHTLIHDIRVTGRHHAIPYFYVPITPSDQDVDGGKVCTPSGSVRPAGLEPATKCLEGTCSVH